MEELKEAIKNTDNKKQQEPDKIFLAVIKNLGPKAIDTLLIIYRVSQEECARLRGGGVPYVKVYRYNPKHLRPKLNSYGDNGQRSLKL